MSRFLTFLAALALTASAALAETATLSYARPTTYTNDAPLAPADIASYNVRCVSFTPTGSTTPGACPTISPVTLPGTATGGTITLTIPGIGGRACFQVQTVTVAAATSAWSNEACKTYAPVAPNPPSNLTVAFEFRFDAAPAA